MTGLDPVTLKAALRAEAIAAGFTDLGICRPDAVPELPDRLAAFLAEDRHGQMSWMAERTAWRGAPDALWPEARSVIMLAEAYTPQHDPLAVLDRPDRAAISVYAQGRDYHDLVKKRLKRVGRWLIAQAPEAQIKVFVDTAPVMEKPLAAAAGLGWQGKHTNLLGRGIGNWVFLGAIFTTVDLPIDAPGEERCGNCTRCLDVCPTNAFPAPFQLDARRCISYLTIEHKGPIAPDLRPALGNRIYGCDDCLAVCPWNKFAQEARETRYQAKDPEPPELAELAQLDDASFRARFSGSPIKRIGVARFLRNVAYAVGNSGQAALRPTAAHLAGHDDPVVAEAGAWALERLAQAV